VRSVNRLFFFKFAIHPVLGTGTRYRQFFGAEVSSDWARLHPSKQESVPLFRTFFALASRSEMVLPHVQRVPTYFYARAQRPLHHTPACLYTQVHAHLLVCLFLASLPDVLDEQPRLSGATENERQRP
jgi:hypothetical protein